MRHISRDGTDGEGSREESELAQNTAERRGERGERGIDWLFGFATGPALRRFARTVLLRRLHGSQLSSRSRSRPGPRFARGGLRFGWEPVRQFGVRCSRLPPACTQTGLCSPTTAIGEVIAT